MPISKPLLDGLRWVAVLPAAYVGAGLGQFAIILGNRLTMGHYIDPESFFGELYVRTASNTVFGALMVGIAAYVAPTYKSHAAMFVGGLFVAASGVLWLSGLAVRTVWDAYAIVVAVVAATATCFQMAKEERSDGSFD